MAVRAAFTEIGAFDAKTRLSEILRKVEQGERFTITRNGQAIADLVPSKAALESVRNKAIDDLLSFPRIEGVDGDTVLEWIREGRE